MNADYQPIACSFHDRLEHWAIRREQVEIVWLDEADQQSATERITDVFARDGADFVQLESGTEIRLDRLVSVGGLELSDSC